MTEHEQSGRLRRVGAMWKPKAGGKTVGSGSVTINALRQRFAVFKNDRKQKDTDPDYVLLSSDEPETDAYAERSAARSTTPVQAPAAADGFCDPLAAVGNDDIPF